MTTPLKHGNPQHQLTKEDSAKGGRTKSLKKKLAQQLRRMREKGMADGDVKELVDVLSDSDASALDIYGYIRDIRQHCTNANQMTNAALALIQIHKAHHGEKQKIESRNVNINVNIDGQEYTELMEEYLK